MENNSDIQSCPKISIITPVYKAEKYLHKCVDSIIAQSFQDWELLLIDDGSPDNSGKICDEYAEKDSRIKVFHKENGGVSSARNLGLNNVRGAWITFIDSDDWIEKRFIADLFKPIERNITLDFVQGGCVKINNAGITTVEQKYDTYFGNNPIILLLKIRGLVISKLFKTSIIKSANLYFDENMRIAEDMAFTLDYIQNVKNYYLNPSIGYYYFQHAESATHKEEKIDIEKYNVKLSEFRHLSSSLIFFCRDRKIKEENCITRYEQIADNLFNCISYLYQFPTKQDFRISRIMQDFSDEELGFLKYENTSKIKKIVSSLLLRKKYVIFDLLLLSIYKTKKLIIRH